VTDPELATLIQEAVRRWSGVACPNEAAAAGLADHVAIIAEFEALRGTLVFEDEPSSFEAALQAEKETAA